MKRSRFSEEQILKILREGEAGRKVEDSCRTHGIVTRMYYRSKAKYGGLQIDEAKRLGPPQGGCDVSRHKSHLGKVGVASLS